MAANNAPLLALPSGSILQFLFMTLPLLGVYLYFLYLAYDRPNIANPNNPQYAQDRIRLMDILITYLVTLIPFSTLIIYMLWFVHKRHTLSQRYEKESISILGNVHYNESYYVDDTMNEQWRDTFSGQVKHTLAKLWAWVANGLTLRNNYGYVVYELERVANHPACNYEDRQIRKKRNNKMLVGTITKKVRVYHRYPREQVSILVLPDFPYSGQPKIDMEADWASFAKYVGLTSTTGGELTEEEIDEVVEDPLRRKNNNAMDDSSENAAINTAFARVLLARDRSRGVLLVSICWVIFLVLASLFVVHQINVVDDVYADEDGKSAWMAFWVIGCSVTPGVACGGNWMRWKMYERWILRSGSKSKGEGAKKQSTRGGGKVGEDEMDYDDENRGGSYVQMN